MTLHEEIAQILKEKSKPLTTSHISVLVNQRKNYRKKDGSEVSPFQIHGRTKNYLNIFLRNKTLVGLKGRDEETMQNSKNEDFVNNTSSSKQVKSDHQITSSKLLPDISGLPVHKIDFLIEFGFIKLGLLSSILSNGFPKINELNSCGIYAITKPTNYTPVYFSSVEAKANGNVISPWSVDKLSTKWVGDADILYYGLAGAKSPRSLKSRLTDLINHCKGYVTDRGPHRGGEIIWQLKCYENFELWILATGNPPEPRQVEENLIKRFYDITGKLPFANRKF